MDSSKALHHSGEAVTELRSDRRQIGDNLLKAVGGGGGLEEPLSLAVSRPVQGVDVVAAIVPDVAPQRVGPLAQPGRKYHTAVSTRGRDGSASVMNALLAGAQRKSHPSSALSRWLLPTKLPYWQE